MIEIKLEVESERDADEIAIALRRYATAMAPVFTGMAEMLRGHAQSVDDQIRALRG